MTPFVAREFFPHQRVVKEILQKIKCLLTSSLTEAAIRENVFLSLLFQIARSLSLVGCDVSSSFSPSQISSHTSLKINVCLIFLSHTGEVSLSVKIIPTMEIRECIAFKCLKNIIIFFHQYLYQISANNLPIILSQKIISLCTINKLMSNLQILFKIWNIDLKNHHKIIKKLWTSPHIHLDIYYWKYIYIYNSTKYIFNIWIPHHINNSTLYFRDICFQLKKHT